MHNAVDQLRKTAFGVSLAAALCTAFLSVWAVLLVNSQHASIAGCVAVLAMIVPIAFARRKPVAMAAVIATATLANVLLFGDLVRCGPALPAAFYVAYLLGSHTVGRARWTGLAFVLAGVVLQCCYDPQLGVAVILLMVPAALLFFGAGIVVRSRSQLITQLRARNVELREQRERTAQLAVATDQARMRSELIDGLRERIHEIAQAAQAGGTANANLNLADIEQAGRATLERMRDIVASMHSAPVDPEPDLDALSELIRSATTCDVRLTVEGEARTLPPSIELSGYRIVEGLLSVLADDATGRAFVRVRFTTEALELSVTGPLVRDRDLTRTFIGIVDRAALHGGTVLLGEPAQTIDARVRLPLVSSYA